MHYLSHRVVHYMSHLVVHYTSAIVSFTTRVFVSCFTWASVSCTTWAIVSCTTWGPRLLYWSREKFVHFFLSIFMHQAWETTPSRKWQLHYIFYEIDYRLCSYLLLWNIAFYTTYGVDILHRQEGRIFNVNCSGIKRRCPIFPWKSQYSLENDNIPRNRVTLILSAFYSKTYFNKIDYYIKIKRLFVIIYCYLELIVSEALTY